MAKRKNYKVGEFVEYWRLDGAFRDKCGTVGVIEAIVPDEECHLQDKPAYRIAWITACVPTTRGNEWSYTVLRPLRRARKKGGNASAISE